MNDNEVWKNSFEDKKIIEKFEIDSNINNNKAVNTKKIISHNEIDSLKKQINELTKDVKKIKDVIRKLIRSNKTKTKIVENNENQFTEE